MYYLAKEDDKLRDVPHFPMVDEAPPRKGFFEPHEYEKLLAALPDYLRLPLAVGYLTGMREGEILGLKWDQVEFLTGTIELLAGETKSDEARTVPIIPQLRALLVERHAKRQPGCPYVCYSRPEGSRGQNPRISEGMVFCLYPVRAREAGAQDGSGHGRGALCAATWAVLETEGEDGLSRDDFPRLAENCR